MWIYDEDSNSWVNSAFPYTRGNMADSSTRRGVVYRDKLYTVVKAYDGIAEIQWSGGSLMFRDVSTSAITNILGWTADSDLLYVTCTSNNQVHVQVFNTLGWHSIYTTAINDSLNRPITTATDASLQKRL